MLFLKIFDDKEKEFELADTDYASPIPDKLRWRNWASDEEGITGDDLLNFVNNELFPKLKDLPVGPGTDSKAVTVKEVFMDSYNYMKSGTLIRQVANKINEINFNDLSERHIFNEIYEKILLDLQSAGNAGEYYTPRAVTQFMADIIDPQLGEVALDPACGTGGFLVCALENMKKQLKSPKDWKLLQNSLHGIEKKPLPHMLCVTNMILHDVEVPRVQRENTLSLRPYRDYTEKDRVDCILTNPPFGGIEEPGIENNFPSAYRTRETADLFLTLIMHLLKNGGRAAVVLPDGFLFGEGVKTKIKERLLEECNLHTIVRLPGSVFAPYTSIKTNLLFFIKGEPTKEIWYFEHPMLEGIKAYSKTKPIRISEFELEKKWWNDRKENEHAWKVSSDEIKERNYNLDIKNPHSPEEYMHDPEELLSSYKNLLKDIVDAQNSLMDKLASSIKSTLPK